MMLCVAECVASPDGLLASCDVTWPLLARSDDCIAWRKQRVHLRGVVPRDLLSPRLQFSVHRLLFNPNGEVPTGDAVKNLALFAMCLVSGAVMAQASHVRQGYVTKNGTYVAPSYATNPNDTKLDNYSTKGNINPYSGKTGSVDPYKVEPLPSYSSNSAPKKKH
jgi:hypothetical protein